MKRLLLLPLLALPLLILSCDSPTGDVEATLLEPPTISADVTIASSPDEGIFGTQVLYPFSQCDNDANLVGGYWMVPTPQDYCIRVSVELGGEPVTGGTVVFQYCDLAGRGTAPKPANDCDNKDGAQWKNHRRVPVNSSGWAQAPAAWIQAYNNAPAGYRWRYVGQGSGVQNSSWETLDVTGFLP